MQYLHILSVLFIGCVLSVSTSQAQTTDYDNSTDDSPYKTVVNVLDNEDDVEILDSEGNLVASVIVFQDTGVEVEKPTDKQICLVKQLGENSTCYEELPLTIDIPENVRAECTGREIVILNSTECDGDKEGNEGVNETSREKRYLSSSCCRYTYYISVRYCGRYCCRRGFWGNCTRYCSNYCTYRIWSRRCIYGYLYRF